jgi:hypothetical protein
MSMGGLNGVRTPDTSAHAAVHGTDVGETTIVCHDGGRIDVGAESMWPARSCLEFLATLEVIGPRQVCVQRIGASDVRRVEREDGAIWTP